MKVLVAGALQPVDRYHSWLEEPWVTTDAVVQITQGIEGLHALPREVAEVQPDEVWLYIDDPVDAMLGWSDDQFPERPPLWQAANTWRDSIGQALGWLAQSGARIRIINAGRRQRPPQQQEAQSLADAPGALFLANVLGVDVPGLFKGATRPSAAPSPSPDVLPRAHFLLGSPFVGSTALANSLNYLYPRLAVGELNRMPQFVSAFPGPVATDAWCGRCHAQQHHCPHYNPEQVSQLARLDIPELFAACLSSSGLPAVVEGSKDPNFLAMVAPRLQPQWRLTATILVRDPLASMASWLATARNEGQTPATANPQVAAQMWRDVHVNCLRVCARLGIPFNVLDFVSLRTGDPRAEVDALLAGLQLDTLPARTVPEPPPASHQLLGNVGVQADPQRRNVRTVEVLESMGEELREAWMRTPGAAQVWYLLGGAVSP